LVTPGVIKPGNMESVVYSSYDNRFYYTLSAAAGGGVYSLSADATGSALSPVISGTTNRVYLTINGTEGWISPAGSSISKVLSLNLVTGVATAVGQDVSSGAGVTTPSVAPNGLVCFGTSATTCRFYEPSTDTTGTFSGTVAADSSYNWILARDGFLYSVPRFTNTSVYRLDPYRKSISTVFTGSPYTANYKRGMWLAPDGSICTVQGTNAIISYNPITNTATTLPFTFTYNSNNMHQGVTYLDGSMYFLNATSQVVRVNNINTRNLFNRAWQGNNAKRGGYN
jgi:streptogramin lyase